MLVNNIRIISSTNTYYSNTNMISITAPRGGRVLERERPRPLLIIITIIMIIRIIIMIIIIIITIIVLLVSIISTSTLMNSNGK